MSAPAVSSPVVSGAGDWSQRLRSEFADLTPIWQRMLGHKLNKTDHCRVLNLGEPVWQDVSDRRGTFECFEWFILLQTPPSSFSKHHRWLPVVQSTELQHHTLDHRMTNLADSCDRRKNCLVLRRGRR